MRLSEAILLGSTIMKPCRMGRAVGSSHDSGCALEMALESAGHKGTWQQAGGVWPWLDDAATVNPLKLDRICQINWLCLVVCTFDVAVMGGEWTLEYFAAWVDSIDPTLLDSPESDVNSPLEVNTEKVTA